MRAVADQDQTRLEFHQRSRAATDAAHTFHDGIRQQRLTTTRCPTCGTVYMPPRLTCATDGTATEWFDLPGSGTIRAITTVHTPPTFADVEPPYRVAIIDIDGTSGSIMHRVIGPADAVVEPGDRVLASYAVDGDVGHPLLQLRFSLQEER